MSNKPVITKDDWLYKTDQEIIDHVYKTFVVDMAPKSTDRGICSYLGKDQGCAVGCLWPLNKRQEIYETTCTTTKGDPIFAISNLVLYGYVELPERVAGYIVSGLQAWHDNGMTSVQQQRYSSFPFLGQVTNPLTEFTS